MCLNDLRKQIDDIDQQLADLLDHRLRLCAMVGQVKKQQGLPIENSTREREILNNVKRMNLKYEDHIKAIMLSIFKESKNLQNTLKE